MVQATMHKTTLRTINAIKPFSKIMLKPFNKKLKNKNIN